MVLCQPVINSKFEQPPNIKHHTFREVNREQLAQNWPATWTLPHGMRVSPAVIPWIRRTMLSAPTSSSASRMPRRTLKSKSGHLGSRTGSSRFNKRRRERCFKASDKEGFDYWHRLAEYESRRITSLYLAQLKSKNNSKEYWKELKE